MAVHARAANHVLTFLQPYLLYLKATLVAAIIGGSMWAGWEWRDRSADLEVAQIVAEAQRDKAELAEAALADVLAARAKEQAAVKRVAQIADQYEQDKIDAQTAADRLVADLRAGNRRLHDRWQAAIATDSLSDAATAASRADAAQRDREASAARAIAAADQCDAQVAGLQAVVRSDREQ